MNEPFTFDRYLALPRLSALKLSPDGKRLVVAVARPDAEGKKINWRDGFSALRCILKYNLWRR